MPARADAWASDWAELRKLNRKSWLGFFGLIAALLLAHALGLPEPIALLMIAPLLIWSGVAGWRASWFSCPRCGEAFFRKRSWGPFYMRSGGAACVHCGLEKYTPSHRAKPFNKITDNWDRLF